jgi:NADPH-dependent FMN reductase
MRNAATTATTSRVIAHAPDTDGVAQHGATTNPMPRHILIEIASFDRFVIVTAENNHGIPAVLKNAIDYLYAEWNHKAVGFVYYGSAGGRRASAGRAVAGHRIRELPRLQIRPVHLGALKHHDRSGHRLEPGAGPAARGLPFGGPEPGRAEATRSENVAARSRVSVRICASRSLIVAWIDGYRAGVKGSWVFRMCGNRLVNLLRVAKPGEMASQADLTPPVALVDPCQYRIPTPMEAVRATAGASANSG